MNIVLLVKSIEWLRAHWRAIFNRLPFLNDEHERRRAQNAQEWARVDAMRIANVTNLLELTKYLSPKERHAFVRQVLLGHQNDRLSHTTLPPALRGPLEDDERD